jgi:hypothetical protein
MLVAISTCKLFQYSLLSNIANNFIYRDIYCRFVVKLIIIAIARLVWNGTWSLHGGPCNTARHVLLTGDTRLCLDFTERARICRRRGERFQAEILLRIWVCYGVGRHQLGWTFRPGCAKRGK